MKILIVEDDIANANFLKTSFEAESFIVDVAHDGERGTYLAKTSAYDIMIIDNVLPKKIGLDVCREIREAGKTAPIIILSVKSEIPAKVELLNAGADDYVLKPYSFNELLARVWAKLRRMNTLESPIIKIGSLTIDTIAQEARNGDTLIYLTRKEFLLLELLMKQRDTVVTRGNIMEHVWDMEGDPFSRTIETHIFNLRKKIGEIKGNITIDTIPGRGYKLNTKAKELKMKK